MAYVGCWGRNRTHAGGVLHQGQFFLYLPSQPLSSEQDWVERDILLPMSNLPPALGFPIVTLYPTPPPTTGGWRPEEAAQSLVVSFVGVSRSGESGVPAPAPLASPSCGPREGPGSGPQFLPRARRDCCSPWLGNVASFQLRHQ